MYFFFLFFNAYSFEKCYFFIFLLQRKATRNLNTQNSLPLFFLSPPPFFFLLWLWGGERGGGGGGGGWKESHFCSLTAIKDKKLRPNKFRTEIWSHARRSPKITSSETRQKDFISRRMRQNKNQKFILKIYEFIIENIMKI